jgi:hypothetical protein
MFGGVMSQRPPCLRFQGALPLDLFGARVRELTAERGRRFARPDEDWPPTLFLLSPERLTIVDLHMFDIESSGDLMSAAEVVERLINLHGAVCAGLITSLWLARRTPGNHPLPGRPLPDSEREMLVLPLAGYLCEQTWAAPVYRDGEQPPALQRWRLLERARRRAVDHLMQMLWWPLQHTGDRS